MNTCSHVCEQKDLGIFARDCEMLNIRVQEKQRPS